MKTGKRRKVEVESRGWTRAGHMDRHEQLTWEETSSSHLFLTEHQEERVLLTDPEKKCNVSVNVRC